MNKLYSLLFIASIFSAAVVPLKATMNESCCSAQRSCNNSCGCGCECYCDENIRRTASVIGSDDLNQLQAALANNQRVIVKFYLGKCPACSFGSFFTELVEEPENADALFIAFNATAVQSEVKSLYALPSLPAIVLFVGGQQQAILKI